MLKIRLFRLIGNVLLVLGVVLCVYPSVVNVMTKENRNATVGRPIGIIEIPKIDVQLSIYEGTEEEILEVGVGHLSETGLPGKKSCHCILAGHRGLPNADLFLRLGEMNIGDEFYITVQDQVMVYKVCQIQVIKPEDTGGLFKQQGRELVSLVTCTPYGLNTHRLVVTGERVEE